MPLLTVGHGPQDRVALGGRLAVAGVDRIVDVRRFPGSRNNPDVARESLEEWLPALGIGYRWDERLGGRRRLPPGEAVADGWWTVAQFAAYAAHTRTPRPSTRCSRSRRTRPSRSCAARACGGAATGG